MAKRELDRFDLEAEREGGAIITTRWHPHFCDFGKAIAKQRKMHKRRVQNVFRQHAS